MDTYNSQLSGMEVAKASRQFRENRVATGSIAPVGWGDGGGGTTREMTGTAAAPGRPRGQRPGRAGSTPTPSSTRARGRAAAPAGLGRRALPRAAPRHADLPAPAPSRATAGPSTCSSRPSCGRRRLPCGPATAYPHDELDAPVAAGAAAAVPRHPARHVDRVGAPRGGRAVRRASPTAAEAIVDARARARSSARVTASSRSNAAPFERAGVPARRRSRCVDRRPGATPCR